jgi:hypothetical protein
MPILEFESSAAKGPAPKKPLKLVLGAGVLVGALALGSTFAANINLNSNNNVEFGQGFVATTACDSDGITVTPFSTFINSTGGGEHKLTSIRLNGIDSSDGACEGKTFRIRAYGDGPDPLDLFEWEEREYLGDNQYSSWTRTEGPFDYVDITRTAPDFFWTSDGTDDDDVIDIDNSTLTETAFTLNLVSGEPLIRRTPLQLADDVKKITVESRDASDAAPVSYSVGDTGPGGGIIFYVAEAPFACGPTLNEVCQYLEAAPNNWSGRGLTEEDPRITWAAEDNQSTSVAGALGTAIGTGYANSLAIANQAGNNATNSAAALALGYSGGGAEDWHLPSSEELRELWKIRIDPHNILLFFSYWSSTQNENNPGQAWDSGGDSPAAGGQKYSTTMVRPIRAFSGSLT